MSFSSYNLSFTIFCISAMGKSIPVPLAKKEGF